MIRIYEPVVAVLCCLALILSMASCRGDAEIKPVCGTLEGRMSEPSVSELLDMPVNETDIRCDFAIMQDTASDVSVWAVSERGGQITDGSGVVVVKNGQATLFPNIRNTRQPSAVYDSIEGNLWLTASVMEGTGVQVEQLYLIRFDADKAYVAAAADPYDVQQVFCRQMGYALEGRQITFYIDGEPMATVADAVPDAGACDEDWVWIGEQLCYDLSGGHPRVCFTPGLKFVDKQSGSADGTAGLVLIYDDMPTFAAEVVLQDSGFVYQRIYNVD